MHVGSSLLSLYKQSDKASDFPVFFVMEEEYYFATSGSLCKLLKGYLAGIYPHTSKASLSGQIVTSTYLQGSKLVSPRLCSTLWSSWNQLQPHRVQNPREYGSGYTSNPILLLLSPEPLHT